MFVTELMGHVRMAAILATLVQSVIRVSYFAIGLKLTVIGTVTLDI